MSSNKYKAQGKEDAGDDDQSRSDVSSGDEADSEDELHEDTGLTQNQQRLLYLISLYTKPAESSDEPERWVRRPALMVLIYEAIVAKVLDYDYAPASEIVEGRRMYFNTSQEGSSDIDFLREEELVNGLKVSSKDHDVTTCYQISIKGLTVIRSVRRDDKEAVHGLAFSPFRSLMQVRWMDNQYWLVAEEPDEHGEEYRVESSVLETEAVSYVSSAYVPACLRQGGRPTMSNAHRAAECGASLSTLRDELDIVVTLNSVSIIVAEYLPMGANRMVELNYHMGSTERVQGGFFTGTIDEDTTGTQFSMPPGMTAVQILDYSITNHLNFEADIRMAVQEGILQVETFGCSVNAYGTCFFGMQLEAVMDRIKDGISLDHLSRLLADVHIDSSRLVDALLNKTQRDMLDLVFRGDGVNRNKVNLIVATEILPHLTAEEYMDRGEYENELKQVVGDTRAAYDVSQHDTLIFGAHGMLLAGPNCRSYEPLLCAYLQFVSMDLFVRNYYNRVNICVDEITDIRKYLTDSMEDPLELEKADRRISEVSHVLILAEKTLSFMTESLEEMAVPPAPTAAAGKALFDKLELAKLQLDLARRLTDLRKMLDECQRELNLAERIASHIHTRLSHQVQKANQSNTYAIAQAQSQFEDTNYFLEAIMYIVSGSLCFDLLDRIIGTYSINDLIWLASSYDMLFGTPSLLIWVALFLWFVLSMCLCWCVARRRRRNMTGLVSFRIELMAKMNAAQLADYVAEKKLHAEHWHVRHTNDRIVVCWDEVQPVEWGGTCPRIQIEYSAHLGLIHAVVATYKKNSAKKSTALTAVELKERILSEFRSRGILRTDERAPKLVFGVIEKSTDDNTTRRIPPKRGQAAEADNMVDSGKKDDIRT